MAINIERRKRVIARSRKLGHCICNPAKGCPCDTLKEQNVCPCAGEKLPTKSGPVALTQHVRKAGCASKIAQADLLRILEQLPPVIDPNVLVGAAAGDDAGVYRIDDTHTLVQTVDVFTPCVDDAHLFGRIAAANSLSDVYAMGGRPITALSVVGFPIDELDGQLMEAMLRGGMETLEEAGCSLIGGHSINDEEIKCGFAITGLIDAAKTLRRDAAHAGDVLVLTKPLGTGMIAFAAQIGRIVKECLTEAGEAMATLNRDAAELMQEHEAHACTDVTGFGLAGHLVEMMRGSGTRAEISMPTLPVFAAVRECLENEILGGAIERNREYSGPFVESLDPANDKNLPVLFDPQTSGGLLISLSEPEATRFVAAMHERGHAATSIIGKVVAAEAGAANLIVITDGRLEHLVGRRDAVTAGSTPPTPPIPPTPAPTPPPSPAGAVAWDEACCEFPPTFDDEDDDVDGLDAETLFVTFMEKANAPGLVDQRTKKLISIALGIARNCDTCLKNHLKSAVQMGITRAEIDEAANLATEFAGCPAMMFYRKISAEVFANLPPEETR